MKKNCFDGENFQEIQLQLTQKVEDQAFKLRDLIISQPFKSLLGFFYAGLLMNGMGGTEDSQQKNTTQSKLETLDIDDAQFILEYIHAVFSSTLPNSNNRLDEEVCHKIHETATSLRLHSIQLAMMIAAKYADEHFGDATQDLVFRALSNWILIRGTRYMVLEEEFFRFVLEPHDDILKQTYGVGGATIAKGIQALSDSIRLGHFRAISEIERSMENAARFVTDPENPFPEIGNWQQRKPEEAKAATDAFYDLFEGGICCVNKHSDLPTLLLDDLSYEFGEDNGFYSPGSLAGTPFRTLPARKKPLLKFDGEHYLSDPSLVRDCSYRAILFNIQKRNPEYSMKFNKVQKEMSETAFPSILSHQFRNAKVFHEVWYREKGNWFENDTLILIDDVLIIVEAKAGAAATIASPESDFKRHAQSVRDLIMKAFDQCNRFLEHLASHDEVKLYRRKNNRYEESICIRLKDYRVVLPIGLTVESYAPFSTLSKQLPGIAPILGKFPFISLSIDELFVINRFLPMTGQLLHYFEIRQTAAGLTKTMIFDEMDHLGAYISKNLFTQDLQRQLTKGADLVVFDGMCKTVDEYFGQPDWEQHPTPAQDFPEEIRHILCILENQQAPGWLIIDSCLRNFSGEGRKQLSHGLTPLRESLNRHPYRYYFVRSHSFLCFWYYNLENALDSNIVRRKTEAAVIATSAESAIVVQIGIGSNGVYREISHFEINKPKYIDEFLWAEVSAAKERFRKIQYGKEVTLEKPNWNPGRNEPCWCGSGTKFKKCHGK